MLFRCVNPGNHTGLQHRPLERVDGTDQAERADVRCGQEASPVDQTCSLTPGLCLLGLLLCAAHISRAAQLSDMESFACFSSFGKKPWKTRPFRSGSPTYSQVCSRELHGLFLLLLSLVSQCAFGLLQIHGDTVQNHLAVQGVELSSYLPLYSPAMDWIFQCISYRAPEVSAMRVGVKVTSRGSAGLLSPQFCGMTSASVGPVG